MKIAVLLSGSGGVNGALLHCRLLTRYLLSKGHKILLIHRESNWISAQPEFQQVKRFETSFTLRPKEILAVGEQILRFDTDVIHTHMSTAHAYGAIYRACGSIPVLATAHAIHFQLHWPFNDQVIATSSEAARFYRKYNFVSGKRIRTIPNFTDTHHFRPSTEIERLKAREQFGLTGSAFVVGFVGDLIRRKRPKDLVMAFEEFARVHSNARLLLAGGSSGQVQDIRSFADDLGVLDRLITPGALADVRQALWAMDVFAHASGKETGPVAVLEAAAVGLPVVATDVGMVSEFVKDGQSGYVVPVGDHSYLANRIRSLSEDNISRIQFGLAASQITKQKYSVESIAPEIETVLFDVSRSSPRARSATVLADEKVSERNQVISEETLALHDKAI